MPKLEAQIGKNWEKWGFWKKKYLLRPTISLFKNLTKFGFRKILQKTTKEEI